MRDLGRYALGLVGAYYLGGYYGDAESAKMTVLIFAIGFFITGIAPCMVIHLQYYLRNRGITLIVDRANRRFLLSSSEGTTSISFDQIKAISVIRAPRWTTREIITLPSDRYRYAELKLVDGTRITITCLLIFNLDKFFRHLGFWPTELRVTIPAIRERERQESERKPRSSDWMV